MDSWNQWQARYQPTPAPAASVPAAADPSAGNNALTDYQYYSGAGAAAAAAATSDQDPTQWQALQQQQHQHWQSLQQQWQQWQTQFQQWQAQYGERYNAAIAAGIPIAGGPQGVPGAAAAALGGPAAQGIVPGAGHEQNPPPPPPQPVQPPSAMNVKLQGLPVDTNDGNGKRPYPGQSPVGGEASKKSKDNSGFESKKEVKGDDLSAFDEQFKRWEQQFEQWKKQNQNHPNKDQYKEYEAKWHVWREQLIQRREQMRKKREQQKGTPGKGRKEKNEKIENSSKQLTGESSQPKAPQEPQKPPPLPLMTQPPLPPLPNTPPKPPCGPPPPPPPAEDIMDKPLQFKNPPSDSIPGLDLLGKNDEAKINQVGTSEDPSSKTLSGPPNPPPGFSAPQSAPFPMFNAAVAPPGYLQYQGAGSQAPWELYGGGGYQGFGQPPAVPENAGFMPSPFPQGPIHPSGSSSWPQGPTTSTNKDGFDSKNGPGIGRESDRFSSFPDINSSFEKGPMGGALETNYPPHGASAGSQRGGLEGNQMPGRADEFIDFAEDFPVEDDYRGSRDNFRGRRDGFRGRRDGFRGGRDGLRGHDFRPPRNDNHELGGDLLGPRPGGPRVGSLDRNDEFAESRDEFGPPHGRREDAPRGPREEFGPPRGLGKDFGSPRGPRDEFGPSRGTRFGPPVGQREKIGPRDDFGPSRGPRGGFEPRRGRGDMRHPFGLRDNIPNESDSRRPDEEENSRWHGDEFNADRGENSRDGFNKTDDKGSDLHNFPKRGLLRTPDTGMLDQDLRIPPLFHKDFRGKDAFTGPPGRTDSRDPSSERTDLNAPPEERGRADQNPPDGEDSFGGNFRGPQGDFNEDTDREHHRDELRGPHRMRDDFRGPPRDAFRGPPGQRDDFVGFHSPRDDFRGPPGQRDDFGGLRSPRDDFRGPRAPEFRGPHGPPRDDLGLPCGPPRDDFGGPRGLRPRGLLETPGLLKDPNLPNNDLPGPRISGRPFLNQREDFRGPPGLMDNFRGPPKDPAAHTGLREDLHIPLGAGDESGGHLVSNDNVNVPDPLEGKDPMSIDGSGLTAPGPRSNIPPGSRDNRDRPQPNEPLLLREGRDGFRGPPPLRNDFRELKEDLPITLSPREPHGLRDDPTDMRDVGRDLADRQSDTRGPPGLRDEFRGPPGGRDDRRGPPGIRDFRGPPGIRGPPDIRDDFRQPLDIRDDFRQPPDLRDDFRHPSDVRFDTRRPLDRDDFRGPREDFRLPFGMREEFEGPPEMRDDFRGPPDLRDDFRGPPDLRDDFRGPPDLRDDFRGPPDLRDDFRGPPDLRDDFRGPPDLRDDFRGLPDERDLRGPPGREFQGPPRTLRPPADLRDDLRGPPGFHDDFRPPFRDEFGGPPGFRDEFRAPPYPDEIRFRDDFRGPHGMRDDLRGLPLRRDEFRGPPGPRDDFRGPPGPRDDFRGPPGPRDDFRGPPLFRDDFRGPGLRDNFRGPPDMRDDFRGPLGPRDEFRGPHGRDDFRGPFESRDSFRGPPGARGDFRGPFDVRDDRGPHGSRDDFIGPHDDFRGSPGLRGDRGDDFRGHRFGRDGERGLLDSPHGSLRDGNQEAPFEQDQESSRVKIEGDEPSTSGAPEDGSPAPEQPEDGSRDIKKSDSPSKPHFWDEGDKDIKDGQSGKADSSLSPKVEDEDSKAGLNDLSTEQVDSPEGSSNSQPSPTETGTDQPENETHKPPEKNPLETHGASTQEDSNAKPPSSNENKPVSNTLNRPGSPRDRRHWNDRPGLGPRGPSDRPPWDGPPDRPWNGPTDRPPWSGSSDRPPWRGPSDRPPWNGPLDRPHWDGPPPGPSGRPDDFSLEPTTVVDYGHKPVAGVSTPVEEPPPRAMPEVLEPVQTFDYGHGSGSRVSPSRSRSPGWSRNSWDRNRERERERDRDRDREFDRPRDRDERFYRDGRRNDRRDRWPDDRGDRYSDRMRNGGPRWRGRDRIRMSTPPPAPPPPSLPSLTPSTADPRPVLIEDLLCSPGRISRPTNLVVILRGPPGSGKSFMAKMIKDKEVDQGGSAPRMLSLDDYFMTEVEKEDRDPETGRKITTKVMEYEYEEAMEKHYRESLLKAFKKTVSDGYFNFIIVDAVNDKVSQFEEMWTFAKSKGFQVYICEMDLDVPTCFKRNIHKRTEKEISAIVNGWESTPRNYLRTDVRSLLQAAAIDDVEMQDASDEEKQEKKTEDEEDEEEDSESNTFMSKWEQMESQGEKLDRLDGLAKRRKDGAPQTLEDWLQMPDDYEEKKATPGKKQVRWADLEERRKQEKMRAIGFVVGQTDWSRMTDPTFGEGALTQTKYI